MVNCIEHGIGPGDDWHNWMPASARIVALLRRAGRTRKGPETTGFVLAWQEGDQAHLSDGNFGGNLRAKSVLLVDVAD